MTNKSLIEKIKDMDIDVEIKSHMSALEDEAVAQIKAGLFGQKSETVVETRVKPTVIRRRKKTVTVEVPPEIEAAEEAEERRPQSRPKRKQLQQKKPRHRRRSQNRRRAKRRRPLQKQRSKPKSKPKKKPKRPPNRKRPQRLRRLHRNQRPQNRP